MTDFTILTLMFVKLFYAIIFNGFGTNRPSKATYYM